MSKKFTSTVAGASILITTVAIISKGFGFFREIIFADYFGLSRNFEIYLVGAILPLTINTVILYLGQNYLIPAYNKIKEKDSRLIDDFVLINFLIFVFAGICAALILYLFSGSIIHLYIQESDYNILRTANLIFRLFLITIPVSCAISFLSAFQQINLEFRYPAYSQLILNISFIIVLIIFANSLGIFAIPLGYIAGSFLQMVFLFKKAKIKFKFDKINSIVKQYRHLVSGTIIIVILIEILGQLYVITDRYFYSYVPSGGIAALNYAQIIFLLPISILSMALSTAIFPYFSHYLSRNLITKMEEIFNQSIKINVAVFIPISILFIYYGNVILKIFFERGQFSGSDTAITYQALIFYSVSLVFYSVYSITNKTLYSAGMVKILLYITIAGILLKIILNFLLVRILEQDGLALSTSISYLFFSLICLLTVYKKISFRNKTIFFTELIFHLVNGAVALLIVKQLSVLIPQSVSLSILQIILFLVLYFLNLFLVKHSAIQIIKGLINFYR